MIPTSPFVLPPARRRLLPYPRFSPRIARSVLAFLLVLTSFPLQIVVPPQPAQAATLTVANNSDSGAGSLRQAIADASAGDTITFDAALNGQTITLTSGELVINKNLAITGPGAPTLAVSGNDASRVVNITAGTVSISGLTVRNGLYQASFADGGGIAVSFGVNLTLSNVAISGNRVNPSAAGSGGGIYNAGTLTVQESTLSGNSVSGGNTGGGIRNTTTGNLTITNSTISGNSANIGGGIASQGTLTVTNSTISGNTSGGGGGLFNQGGMATLTNATVSSNTGGSIRTESSGSATLTNSILAAGGGANCTIVAGGITNGGSSLSSDASCTGFTQSSSINLGALADNGGPTQTHALLAGSAAIDAGPSGGDCTGTDQRGIARPQSTRCDIGAFELENPLITIAAAKIDADSDFVPDPLGRTVRVRGVVTSVDFRGATGTEVYIQDATGGIDIFSTSINTTMALGDSIEVTGTVLQFNGLTQNGPSAAGDLVLLPAGTVPAVTPEIVTVLQLADGGVGETYEGKLLRINNVTLTSPPATFAADTNYTITDGVNNATIRIDSDTDIDGTAPPAGAFSVIGVLGQFDNAGPFDSGYQLLPRILATDFIAATPFPTITGFAPTTGPAGTSVIITGNNFTGATAVTFNGTAATALTVVSNTQITATVPNGAPTGPIAVTSPSGTGTSATNFAVTAGVTLNISDVTLNEGNAGTTTFTFNVTLTAPAGPGGVTFDIATADDTAQDDNPPTEDNDYVANALTGQTIPAGSTGPYQFSVTVNGDTAVEPNETFFVNVTNIVGAAAGDVQGLGTITTDDTAAADLSITKTGPTLANADTDVSYTLTVTYNGPSSAQTVEFVDPLPGDMTFVSATQHSGPAFNCPLPAFGTNGTIRCTNAALPAGTTVTVTVDGHIPPGTAAGTQYLNTVTISSTTPDPNPANNSSSVTTRVGTATTTTLASSRNPSFVGQSVAFTGTVSDSGGTPTGTVTFIVDGVPQAPVTLVGGQATFTTNTLAAGSHIITATYNGDANFAGSTSTNFGQTVATPSLVVNSAGDAVDATPGNGLCETATAGQCTLRAAIMEANELFGANTITFAAAINGTPITLTIAGRNEEAAATGDLDITGDVTITGNGATNTIIEACNGDGCIGVDRLFDVRAGTSTIAGVTVRNGNFNSTNLGESTRGDGGGIRVLSGATLTLDAGTVSGNRSDSLSGLGGGGGIFNDGTLTVTNSTVSNNTDVVHGGGGIFNDRDAFLTLTNSTVSGNTASMGAGIYSLGTLSVTAGTISGNTAGGDGGGIRSSGATITRSTISGNTGHTGGGISNGTNALTVRSSTVSGNNATGGGGGGVYSSNQLDLESSTFHNNTASSGGGSLHAAAGVVNATATIVSGSTPAACVREGGAIILSGGYNISNDASCEFAQGTDQQADPLLGPLQNNGGPTQTHALLPGSPALDAIPAANAACTALTTDQRGIARPQFGACDIGAFELEGIAPTITSADNATFIETAAGSFTVTATGFPTPGLSLTGALPAGVTFANAGSFGTPTDYPAPARHPAAMEVGDLNSDGRPDIIMANAPQNDIAVLLGTGGGAFGAAAVFPVGGVQPRAIALGDFNMDTLLDVVSADSDSDYVSVVLGDGTGAFGSPRRFDVGDSPQDVAVAALNSDNNLDLVVANAGSNNVTVLLGSGAGTFLEAVGSPFAVGGTIPRAVAVADVTGDGRLDTVTANFASNTVAVLAGDGAGGFAAAQTFAVGGGPLSVATADLNRDGLPDLISANSVGNTISVLLGTGGGAFGAEQTFAVGALPVAVTAADLDGDGVPDLAVVQQGANSVGVLRNTTPAGAAAVSFSALTSYAVGSQPAALAAADVSGDGIRDLIAANTASNNASVLLGGGDGTATLWGTPSAGSVGTYNLTFTAANGVAPNAVQTFTLTVNAVTGFEVNTLGDAVDASIGNGICDSDLGTAGLQCTLRAAIQESNALSGAQTITFNAALNGQAITMTVAGTGEDAAATGDLDITGDTTITGNGAANTVIEAGTVGGSGGNGIDRVFHLLSGTVGISGVTIRNGRDVVNGGGGILSHNTATLTLTDSVVSGNTSLTGVAYGGGIYHAGPATLINSTVSGNESLFGGGGILSNGDLTLTNSTVTGNIAGAGGGGFASASTVVVTNSTLSNNTGSSGGAIWIQLGSVTLTNSTVSGNTGTGAGGAIYHFGGTLAVNSSTLSGNSSAFVGGIAVNAGSPTLTLTNSIINSAAGANCNPGTTASVSSGGNNLISDTSCGFTHGVNGDIVGQDPLLGALASNGGPTQTHMLLPGSPAVNAGAGCGAADQRGVARPLGAACDIGAFELLLLTVNDTADADDVTRGDGVCETATGNDVCTLRAAVREANAFAGTDAIAFDAAINAQPITLTGVADEDAAVSGDLDITESVYLAGNGVSNTIIDGGANDRVFEVVTGGSTISGVTVRNGNVSDPGQGGGGIRVGPAATLAITASTITGNTAAFRGGGLFNEGVLTLLNSSVSGNIAFDGGGIYTISGGTLTVTGSTVSGNTASAAGGGILNLSGTLTVTSSTISANTASAGGGIYTLAPVNNVASSTLGGNSASAGAGGGIWVGGGRTITLTNSILSSAAGGNCYEDTVNNGGAVVNGGGNLSSDDSCGFGTDSDSIDPMLGPLADNGGPTLTHGLLTGSPAINAGANCGTADQRGAPRPARGACDIGAFEAGVATQLVFMTQPGGGTGGAPWVQQPIVAVRDASGFPVTDATNTVTLVITGGTGPAGATLTCTSNPLSALNGSAAFADCRIDRAGTGYTLTASAARLTDAISSAFTVSVGPPAQLAFIVQPGGSVVNTAWAQQAVVEVRDAGGNRVPTASDPVKLDITTGSGPVGAALLCIANPVAASGGLASFSGCGITLAAPSYRLTASSGLLTPATSDAFTVTNRSSGGGGGGESPPPPPTTGAGTVKEEGGSFSSGRVDVSWPASAVTGLGTLVGYVAEDTTAPPCEDAPQFWVFGDFRFSLVMNTAAGETVTQLRGPFTVIVELLPSDIALAEGNLNRLRLLRFDAANNSWVELNSTLSGGETTTLTAQTDRTGMFAVGIIQTAPVLISPETGALIIGMNPVVQWINGESMRQVQIQVLPTNNDGPGINLILGTESAIRSAGQFAIATPGTGNYILLPGMTYNWRVRNSTSSAALEDASCTGWSEWSASRTFKTGFPTSATIHPVSPPQGAPVPTLNPTVTWRNDNPGIFYYEVQLSKDPRFETEPGLATAAVYWNIVHGGVTEPPDSWQLPRSEQLEANTVYYWRVRPRVQGDGTPVAWTDTWHFRTP